MIKETKREKETTRSSHYEYKMYEIPVGGLFEVLNLAKEIETNKSESVKVRIFQLRDSMASRIIFLIEETLSDYQWYIMKMHYLQGKTQAEIAEILDCPQTTVSSSIHGHLIYNERGKPLKDKNGNPIKSKRYGGSIKKTLQAIRNDEKLNLILKELIELEDFFPPKDFLCWKMIKEDDE